jgi:hypothetical protein
MNGTFARVLNLVPRGQHAADALTDPPPSYERYPVTADAVAEARTEAFHLAAQGGIPTVAIPALSVDVTWPPRVTIADDYRDLRVFPAVVRGACRVGLTGIGTRGAFLVAPLPDWDLGEVADDTPAADFGPEFDQVAERYEAGFYKANRWFHSEDTAGFPAVAL